MSSSPLLTQLIEALQCLPGVGPKSAQRAAFHLLQRDRDGARRLAEVMAHAMDDIGRCSRCRTLSETDLCALCAAPAREDSQLLVVESPIDIAAIESSTEYRGRYFVLLGHLSPIDGITPETLGMPLLAERLAEGGVNELIIATGATMEGEATAHYLKTMADRADVESSRIAFGVPMGGELEFVDGSTLSAALNGRRPLS